MCRRCRVRRVVTHTGVTDTPTRVPKQIPDVSDTPDESDRSRYSAGIYRRPILFPTFPTLPTLASDGVPKMWTAVRHVYLNSAVAFWTIWSSEHLFIRGI
jgi:hypothetical protein